MKLFLLFLLSLSLLSGEQTFSAEAEIAKMKAEYEAMKKEQTKSFDRYKVDLETEYKAYQDELKKYWKNPSLSSQKEWISYSVDNKSRSKVDFENDKLVIEVIAKDKEDAYKLLKERLAYVVSKNTQEVIKSDPLQSKIAQLVQKDESISISIDNKPILQTVIFDKEPSKEELEKYTQKVVDTTSLKTEKSLFPYKNVYSLSVNLPKDTTLKRSRVYKTEIVKNANRFEIPIPLVFAIMHTESNFNPFAKSHIPAYGLMQIVPKSAGRDVYRFLYKKDGMPSATYLYNSKNNIEMGSVYLHILYYRYLKKIKNPESRLYCSIAAYNTGAGNIAWAFTQTHNMNLATPKINSMSPDEVYKHLLLNLKYDEPKHYLKRVKKRMSVYKKAYNL